MADQARSEIIKDNPIGKGLDAFRASYTAVCENQSIPSTLDSLGKLGHDELQNIALVLLSTLQILPAARLLRSSGGRTLFSELPRLNSAITSDDFDLDGIKPLLNAALADSPDDVLIWDQVYNAVTESTPPLRPIASSVQQTPWLRNTSSFANSSEHRKYVDAVLKEELGPMYVGLRNFHETYFGDVADLETASAAVFKMCMEGNSPIFCEGWSGWPEDANQDHVLGWFAELSEKLAAFAEDYKSTPTRQRRPLAQPNKPIDGSIAKRKMDIGFVNDPEARKDSRCHWSQILVPGELKSNRSADIASEAWLDLGRYAREVLAAQDTRRFVLGFTICGSLMRVWEFDRLGGIASKQFDINEDGLQFVSTILAFLWMNEEQLGFDPTVITENGLRFIEIQRKGTTERLIIDGLMTRARCISGRATTCWKAHREGDPQTPLVIKDSWQYTEREEEGELLREATDKGVVNVARYYHHEIVRVLGTDDDVRSNVRKGLDIMKAENYRPERSMISPSRSTVGARKGRSSSTTGLKRSSSQTGAPLPPSKRSCSTSPTKAGSNALPNRVHRRVILRDYGKPIYKAGSRAALLTALEGCIEGHESLRKAGFLHRDISINNLMMNEDEENPSWPSFLIDLDLGIKETRREASGARGKTGTRAFMAIGALLGEQHTFMHDLESIFWVLFWICIHYDGPNQERVVAQFDKWNYVDMEELAKLKLGTVAKETIFMKTITDNFTSYFEPLIPWVNRLRKIVFPRDRPQEQEDERLYSRIKGILREACEDLT
ncbi:hypothetical protein BKA61DRAFT_189254 [Leptodontidium sp. MPI-SDFR-AT-0119]|nr:hypothetical protein BKA61DRAFT_189254 [Leptodontidium sp. MPI-SDFR-AT-0119]